MTASTHVAAAVTVLCVSLATSSSAQVTARSTVREVGHVFEDVGYLWSTPFRGDRADWAVAGLSAATFAALLPADARVDGWIVSHEHVALVRALAPFREAHGPLSRAVTVRQLVPFSGALVLAGVVSGNRALREAGYGCIAGWGLSNSLRYTIYAAVARDRPYVAEGDAYRFRTPGGLEWDSQSFFAGHTTNAFACAAFWNERFELGLGEPVIYAAAAMTALSRIADRRHWTSDTFVGVMIGIAAGRTIAARYAHREDVRERARDRVTPTTVILWRGEF